MWYALTHHWNLARVLRVILGGMMAYQGILTHETGVIVMGGAFTLFSVFTTGCCGSQCEPMKQNEDLTNDSPNEIVYEEVK